MTDIKLRDWLNLIAAVSVLAGLFLVTMELRLTNELASAQSLRDLWSSDNEIDMFAVENGIPSLVIKSVDDPLGLTDEEIDMLSIYLTMEMQHQIMVASMRDQFGEEWGTLELQAESIVDDFFGGQFARGWFNANEGWLSDYHLDLTAAVKERIARTPVDREYTWPSTIRESVRRVVEEERE